MKFADVHSIRLWDQSDDFDNQPKKKSDNSNLPIQGIFGWHWKPIHRTWIHESAEAEKPYGRPKN